VSRGVRQTTAFERQARVFRSSIGAVEIRPKQKRAERPELTLTCTVARDVAPVWADWSSVSPSLPQPPRQWELLRS